jgi:15-cis-phytoene desaturase
MGKNVGGAIVIGGGLAGLSCAAALADRGVPVTLLESEQRLGGRAASWQDEATGDAVDLGPHVFHSEYRNMLAFLQRLGTSGLIRWQPDPVLTIASKPRAVHLRHGPMPPPFSLMGSMLGAPGLSLADLMSMSKLSWRVLRFGEEEVAQLDQMTALDYFRAQGVSERMIGWWWRFASMVVTNVPLERCSAASIMRIHAQLSSYRGLHFGFAQVGLGELYARQAVRAIEAAGGRVLLDTRVAGLTGQPQVDGVALADGTQLHARYVISTLPPQALAPLLPAALQSHEPFRRLNDFEPSPYISCYLWFDRPIGMERFVSHLYGPERLNYDFYDLTQIRKGWSGRPTVSASNIIYSHRAAGMDDGEIVAATVRELAEFAPQAAQAKVRHARVHRIPMAIPCPTVGFERMRPGAGTQAGGLLLAGDWTQTHLPCSMESAVKSGFTAAEQVLASLGRPARLALQPRPYDGLGAVVRPLATGQRGPERFTTPGKPI